VELAAVWPREGPKDVTVTGFDAHHASEDAEFVRRAIAGDGAAFTALYERYARMIHGVLLARVRTADVDDLVQDVFLSAWTHLERLRDAAAFGGWLAMIARNRATDFTRRSVEAVDLPVSLQAHDATAASAEAHAVLDVIRALPETYRETLMLRLVEGMTGPEIAARTGLTGGSVRVNLHRGMKLLREKLDA
jgi:RNA polymerase sigma-70 factor (ECF subfamily)